MTRSVSMGNAEVPSATRAFSELMNHSATMKKKKGEGRRDVQSSRPSFVWLACSGEGGEG
jgi:hypothetical protein